MWKKVCAVLIGIFMTTALIGCKNNNLGTSSGEKNVFESNNGKLKVVVSFNPMAEFTKAIGKDKVDIKTIIPTGTEAHDFEPKPKDLVSLSKAKVFVYNGFGMEPWVDKAIAAANNRDLTVVEAARGCPPIKNSDEEALKEHGQYDPHTWISLSMAKIEAKNVADALIKADPSNKEYYEKNYSEFASKIESMLSEYKEKFDKTERKNFVTGHAAFAYFCRDFNLEQNSVENVFAEGEPTAKKIQDLIQYSKANNVKTIFMEDMVSPKVSETLAKEVNGKVEKISTIENKEEGKDYLQVMKENLDKVYDSLK